MTQLLDWLTKYSPAVVLLLAFRTGLLFVIKLIVEKSITSEIDAKSKVFESLLKRRSAFEEKALSDRFALITGLSTRLELHRAGHEVISRRPGVLSGSENYAAKHIDEFGLKRTPGARGGLTLESGIRAARVINEL